MIAQEKIVGCYTGTNKTRHQMNDDNHTEQASNTSMDKSINWLTATLLAKVFCIVSNVIIMNKKGNLPDVRQAPLFEPQADGISVGEFYRALESL